MALAADAAECLVRDGAAAAMNRFNGRPGLSYTSTFVAGREAARPYPCSR